MGRGPVEATGGYSNTELGHRPGTGVFTVAWQAAVITLFVQVPSYADVYKYVEPATVLAPALVVITYAVIFAALRVFYRAPRLRELCGGWLVTAAILIGLTVVSIILFRQQTTRLSQGAGSTASQAMSFPVDALLDGRQLYDVQLSGLAPVSPGPGWILLNSPFTMVEAYSLFLPFWLIVTSLTLRGLYRRPFEVNLGLAILCISPAFLRLLGEGHDVIAFGCAAVLLVALMDHYVDRDRRAILFGIVSGLVATTRFVFLPLPALLALLLWSRSRRQAVIVGAVGVVVAGALSALFAQGAHPYLPFHVLHRGDDHQPVVNIMAGVMVTGAAVIGTLRFRRADVTSWFCWFGACLGPPLAFIGFGELESSHYAFATWEGANYVMAGAIPVLVAVLAFQARANDPPAVPELGPVGR